MWKRQKCVFRCSLSLVKLTCFSFSLPKNYSQSNVQTCKVLFFLLDSIFRVTILNLRVQKSPCLKSAPISLSLISPRIYFKCQYSSRWGNWMQVMDNHPVTGRNLDVWNHKYHLTRGRNTAQWWNTYLINVRPLVFYLWHMPHSISHHR